tara:strand:- start:46 stop:468 length:423 start_codon:yes stop_codon:yes gene_type:complete
MYVYTEVEADYIQLKKEVDDFFSKLKKDKTELVIKPSDEYQNEKKRVSIKSVDDETNNTALDKHGWEDYDEGYIKDRYIFINKDIDFYKEAIYKLINNYTKIKNEISSKLLNKEINYLREEILKSHNKLHELKDKYIWEI